MLKTATKIASLPDWGRFTPAIPVQNGRSLFTLRDAAQYVLALPAAEQKETRWQTAASVLKLVAETGGDPMMARIGMMKALHDREPQTEFPARRRARKYTLIR